ncbi:TenA family protein [Rouxiella chamberiensis]|uniref:Aminopyrimidine aminohydrolase n=1 Tax=Rouxiella chamberiensis TaxID=1513468 RepID=A0ABY7HSW8_9GAMM|nr:TenA family protein [Rouxiella chamberiensis]WAT02275.1 TenA family protein [Rouxiella chamberiensis]
MSTQTSFTDQLLARNQAVWQAMQQHPFVTDIEQGKLDASVFNQYLVFEGDFVATAIQIFSYAVIKAPSMTHQRRLIGVLDALANEQIAYFERVMQKRGVSAEAYLRSTPDVYRFSQGMLRVAETGSYAEILTLMFGAEWMYYQWCKRVSQAEIRDADVKDWVVMHAERTFIEQASWLKAELDTLAATLNHLQRAQLSALYAQVLQWEIDFHSAAYFN